MYLGRIGAVTIKAALSLHGLGLFLGDFVSIEQVLFLLVIIQALVTKRQANA